MIKFSELEKLKPVRDSQVEQAKQETLEENQMAEIEARIDRAIKLTRLSNIDTTEITVYLGNKFPAYLVTKVADKYLDEGYFIAIGSSDNIYVNICWDQLVNRQLDKIKLLNKYPDMGYKEAKNAISDTDDVYSLITDNDAEDLQLYIDNANSTEEKMSIESEYNWIDEFQSDSWDRAIYFADKYLRGTPEEIEEGLDTSAIVVIENIIDAFLLKIFGPENSEIALLLGGLIERELESIDLGIDPSEPDLDTDPSKIIDPRREIDKLLYQIKQLNK